MLRWFRCTGGLVEVEKCLKHCVVGERCLTLPTLRCIADERKWDGTPHVTNLLNGTLYEWLKITRDYSIDPQERAFTLLGSGHHKLLEQYVEAGEKSEIKVLSNVMQGSADHLEPDESGEGYVLTDYKSWGSFKVAKSLGIQAEVVGKGPRGGKVYRYYVDESKMDMWEVSMQLNGYRRELERAGVPITRMQVQVTVRDGGLQAARSRGVDKKMYLIPIDKIDDEIVDDYFEVKSHLLRYAIEHGEWDEPCDERENWKGDKCSGFCEVALYCVHRTLRVIDAE